MTRRHISKTTREKLRAAGRKRAQQFTPEYQSWVRSHLSSRQAAANGKKGYKALVEAGKENIASEKAAEWRRANPSSLEQIVMAWLDEAGINYQREVNIDRFYVDFLVGRNVVEVNGAAWHENEATFKDEDVKARDQGKYKMISKLGYAILVLPEVEIVSGEAKQKLLKFLEGYQNELPF